ncbi:MAG: GDP-L-fucose synthase [Porphyromonadaceae bacterium]|nr:GDP-L-fucose synthase [Porphyromonadaceae bacterium]
MRHEAKIYVAGHRGLVGSAIWRTLEQQGYSNLIGRTHAELDLMDAASVRTFFEDERPDYVFLAAAYVGGIMANNTYRADFIYNNLAIQQNVIGESYRTGVKKLLFLGSTCIYPRQAPQPMREDALLTSPLEYTNEPYAIAKIAGLKLCESFNLQYGTNFIAVMPTNLYGPGDNFHLENSHVLPAMLRKFHLAKALSGGDFATIRRDLAHRPVSQIADTTKASEAELTSTLAHYGIYADRLELWGSGKPMREFLWSEDMAAACIHVMNKVDFDDLRPKEGEVRNTHLNIGTGLEISIADLAEAAARTIGFEGKITFDPTKPDGTMRKLTDPSRINALGWRHTIEVPEGLNRLYAWYLEDMI